MQNLDIVLTQFINGLSGHVHLLDIAIERGAVGRLEAVFHVPDLMGERVHDGAFFCSLLKRMTGENRPPDHCTWCAGVNQCSLFVR